MSNKDTVLDTFNKAGKPLKAGEVAEATGIDKAEVSKIIKALKTEGSLVSPKNCFYETAK
ncbi:MAG: helix-turn-helix domain-containing protein [Streptococcaceae bacterium]|jgi:DNA-binding IclR family transcriptional regulator|nr:helix-turn-helix domain-containing protein [Streptococcaceae bacterium]